MQLPVHIRGDIAEKVQLSGEALVLRKQQAAGSLVGAQGNKAHRPAACAQKRIQWQGSDCREKSPLD